MIKDMKNNMDPSQYGNTPGVSINHYLIKLIDRVLKATDNRCKGESVAVICNLVDFSKAFDRQSPLLGIRSFIQNGVRPSLIPILISFFQNRRMKVKWHGVMTPERPLYGGGPQGSTMGILEYLSLSNDKLQNVQEEDKYSFIDDLSLLELINLTNIGMQSYNVKQHVPSHIPDHNQFIHPDKLKSQQHLNDLSQWTDDHMMKLNPKKCKNLIFNFTNNHQFSTALHVNNHDVETVKEAKLLGSILTDDLKWSRNTEEIVKSSNKRLRILHEASKFTRKISDLKIIYTMFIRSKLDCSSVVWHSSLTEKEINSLERVQKSAVKVILKNNYKSYEDALEFLNLDSLQVRRKKQCLKFAKDCLKHEKMKELFPLNVKNTQLKIRFKETYKVNKANTERYKQSAIPYLQNLLNEDEQNRNKEKKRYI